MGMTTKLSMQQLFRFTWRAFALLCIFPCISSVSGSILKIQDIAGQLKNSLSVQLALMDVSLAKAEQSASLYPLDTQIALAHSFESDNQPQNSTLENSSIREKTTSTSIGLNKMFSYGTKVDLSLQSIDIETDSINTVFLKRNQLAALVKIEQPILSGRSIKENLTESIQSPFKVKRYQHKFIQTYSNELKECYDLYWDIFLAKNEIRIRNKNINIYKNLKGYYKQAKDIGNKGNLKYIEVSSLLEKEKALVLLKKNNKNSLILKLNKKINGRFQDIDISTIKPLEFTIKNWDKVSISKSDSNELLQEKLKLKELQVELDASKSSMLPKLDLSFEYLSTGLSTNKNNSFKNVKKSDFPNITVGVAFNWSFGNNYEEGKYVEKLSKVKRKEKELIQKNDEIKEKIFLISKEMKVIKKINNLSINRKANIENDLIVRKEMFKHGRISIIELEEVISRNTDEYLKILGNKIEMLNKENELMLLVNGYKSHIKNMY